MRPRRSGCAVLLLATATATAAATGCSKSSSGAAVSTTTTSTTAARSTRPSLPAGACQPRPAPAAVLAWLPADLPFPPGTFAVQELRAGPGTWQALLAAPVDLVGFVKFVNAEWPAHGWGQGRGEAEQGEAENTFVRAGGDMREGGAWRVRQPYCDAGLSEVLLVYKK
jgi:hypothetical protein